MKIKHMKFIKLTIIKHEIIKEGQIIILETKNVYSIKVFKINYCTIENI